jgi:UDP-N-acetylmuramate--alanine ligase
MDASVWLDGTQIATLSLAVPGRHNVRNALAALVVAGWNGVPPQRAAAMLRDFRGAGRRFEVIGQAGGVTVIDDYGHHPTEIVATLTAARLHFPGRRLWAVFQPHTYSRTQALLAEFARSFDDADRVLLLDIYAARERNDLGLHSRHLLARMSHPGAQYAGGIEDAADYLLTHVEPDDVVITLSAGDGNRVGRLLLEGLREREGMT